MTSPARLVAMLIAHPGLASILGHTLGGAGEYRVATFPRTDMLTTFLRISPVDAVVIDEDQLDAPLIDVARGLRAHPKLASPIFEIVALTRAPTTLHEPLLAAGISVVLRKPVAPRGLIDCVDGLLYPDRRQRSLTRHQTTASPSAPQGLKEHPAPLQRRGNIIPLFGEGRHPTAR